MKIRFEEGLHREYAQLISQWSNTLGRAFQEQWVGPKLSFPLTVQALQELKGVFSIFDGQEFVGVIQQIRIEDRNVHIGKFLINPNKQGQGFGRQDLKDFIHLIFENEAIESISLTVFEINQTAKNLYQKEGFEIDYTIERPERKFIMKKYR